MSRLLASLSEADVVKVKEYAVVDEEADQWATVERRVASFGTPTGAWGTRDR